MITGFELEDIGHYVFQSVNPLGDRHASFLSVVKLQYATGSVHLLPESRYVNKNHLCRDEDV